jgi:hypothetical protein
MLYVQYARRRLLLYLYHLLNKTMTFFLSTNSLLPYYVTCIHIKKQNFLDFFIDVGVFLSTSRKAASEYTSSLSPSLPPQQPGVRRVTK